MAFPEACFVKAIVNVNVGQFWSNITPYHVGGKDGLAAEWTLHR